MQTPNTTDAVAAAIQNLLGQGDTREVLALGFYPFEIAEVAIQAHNKKMAELVPERTKPANTADEFWQGQVAGFNEARRLILGDDA